MLEGFKSAASLTESRLRIERMSLSLQNLSLMEILVSEVK